MGEGVTGKARGLRAWEGRVWSIIYPGSRKRCLGPEAYTRMEPHCPVISDLLSCAFPQPKEWASCMCARMWHVHIHLGLWVWSV